MNPSEGNQNLVTDSMSRCISQNRVCLLWWSPIERWITKLKQGCTYTSSDHFSVLDAFSFNMHNTQKEESEVVRNEKGERIKLRSRSSRLALMVNDMLLAPWLGLAQESELLKYLRGVRNERLVHFKSAEAERGSKPGHFSTSSLC